MTRCLSTKTGQVHAETESHVQSRASTVAEGTSSMRNRASSSALGASQMTLSGSGTGAVAGQMLTPDIGLLNVPQVIGLSEAQSSSMHSAQGNGAMSSRGRMSGSAEGHSSMRGEAFGEAWGYATTRSVSEARSVGVAETHGNAQSRGTQEAFESLYGNLPSAVHGKENMLYFAAQTLRGLSTGQAFVNFVDGDGVKAAVLSVPRVENCAPAPAAFEELRKRVLEQSPSASRAGYARQQIDERERRLIAATLPEREPAEPDTPAGYRTKRKRVDKVRP